MFNTYYFILGIVNNLFLISIFIISKIFGMDKFKGLGIAYLLLTIPSEYMILIAGRDHEPYQYIVFLSIFIAFLILEGVYDYILKIPFRRNWKLLIPYLTLYWSMNYGFIVMVWKNSLVQGGIMLGLFILQLTANLISHTRKKTAV